MKNNKIFFLWINILTLFSRFAFLIYLTSKKKLKKHFGFRQDENPPRTQQTTSSNFPSLPTRAWKNIPIIKSSVYTMWYYVVVRLNWLMFTLQIIFPFSRVYPKNPPTTAAPSTLYLRSSTRELRDMRYMYCDCDFILAQHKFHAQW